MVTGESAIPMSRTLRAADDESRWAKLQRRVPAFLGGAAGTSPGNLADPEQSFECLSYIDSLHALLAHKKIDVTKTYLLGISGDAFKFFYDHIQPARSMWVFLHNPLRAACSVLGMKHDIPFHENQKDALAALAAEHDKGDPVIVKLGDEFPIVYPGYRIVYPDRQETLTRGEFEQQWEASDGFLELGLFGYHFFTLGDLDQELKQRDIYLGAFRRGRKIAHIERRVRGCFIGLRAFDGMVANLTAARDPDRVRPVELERIADWNGLPSLHLLESRRAAIQFILAARESFEEEEELKAIDDAVKYYQRCVTALEQVRARHPSSDQDGPSNCVFKPGRDRISKREFAAFIRACKKASASMVKASEAEYKGVHELGQLISVSEKTKM